MGANPVTVKVQDNGSPVLSSTNTFVVTVQPAPIIRSVDLSGDVVTLTWDAIPGRSYRLETNSALASGGWAAIPGNIVTGTATATVTDSSGMSTGRFYRVLVLP